MTNGLLIFLTKYLRIMQILGNPSSYMTVHLIPSEFPYVPEKFSIFFISAFTAYVASSWRTISCPLSLPLGSMATKCNPWTYISTEEWLTGPNIWFMYIQKWNCSFLIPTFMYLWSIHIFQGLVCLFGRSTKGRPILGIFKSVTDTWMWKLGDRTL